MERLDVDMLNIWILPMDIDFVDDNDQMDVEKKKKETQEYYQNLIFVDMQGFKTFHNRFMCKEFSLVDGEKMFHAFVKSPYSFNKLPSHYRRHATWLTNHYHRIPYDCGDTHIVELKQKLFPMLQNKTIIVKGAEKVQWLEYMFRDCGSIVCINIEDLDFDMTLGESDVICDFHNQIFGWADGPCAMTTTSKLKAIVDKNYKNEK